MDNWPEVYIKCILTNTSEHDTIRYKMKKDI